jgi:hypothetical protein
VLALQPLPGECRVQSPRLPRRDALNYDQEAMIAEVMSVFNPNHKACVFQPGPRMLKGKTYRIKTKDQEFADLVRESPVDRIQIRFRRKVLVGGLS